ncbi:MAG: hypothetical protein ABW123_03470 [Cystobacter sp.]
MARQTWMGLGVAALGMAIVLNSEPGGAQDATQDQGAMSSSSSSAAETEAQQNLEEARLRTQVARLQQQLAQMRTQLAQAQQGAGSGSSEQGVGGSGTSAIGDPNAEAPEGATGLGYASGVGGSANAGASSAASSDSASPGASGDASNSSGFALANVLHTGRVLSVTPSELVLEMVAGSASTLSLARDVQVLRDGQPVALGELESGTRVRTSANLVAPGNPVTRIEILPKR